MRLAVVIPTLNAGHTLPDTLAALGDHPQQIVVADGGSSDTTLAIANRFGARSINAPRGRGLQLQAGIQATQTPWLLLLHADTRLAPGWHDAACDHATRFPDWAAYFRFALRSQDRRARLLERLVEWRCSRFALPYGDQGLLLPRALLQRVGGIRPLPLMEDVDLVRRIGPGHLRALPVAAQTSPVRWEQHGWLRRSARNMLCLGLWNAGVPPARIARFYD